MVSVVTTTSRSTTAIRLLAGLPGVVVEVVLVNGGGTPGSSLSDETIGSAPANAFMWGAQAPEIAGGLCRMVPHR